MSVMANQENPETIGPVFPVFRHNGAINYLFNEKDGFEMKLQGETVIPAPRDIVWNALNDESLLVACIPGCDVLERVSDTELAAAMTVKLGPVKAKFKGDVKLENIDAPVSYRLVGEGKGAAGFARGHADVVLAELDGGTETRLSWSAEASVGGKLAQMGARLIDSTAKKYADEFFGKFNSLVSERVDKAVDAGPVPAAESVPDETERDAKKEQIAPGSEKKLLDSETDASPQRWGLPPYIWVTVLALAILALLYGLAG